MQPSLRICRSDLVRALTKATTDPNFSVLGSIKIDGKLKVFVPLRGVGAHSRSDEQSISLRELGIPLDAHPTAWTDICDLCEAPVAVPPPEKKRKRDRLPFAPYSNI